MKILTIAPQPFFTPRGTPLSVYYRTLVTAEMGIDVDLLTYGEGKEVDIPGVRIIRIPHFQCLGSVKIGPSFLKIFLDFLILFWTVRLLFKNKYKVVHAHEEAIFICYFLKPFFHFKLIYDMHSSLPEQLTNFNFTQSKLIIKLFSIMENACLHTSDAIITICPSLYNYAKQNVENKKLVVLIENSICDKIKFKHGNNSRNSIHNNSKNKPFLGKRVVVYAGTLETYQGIDILIRAFHAALKLQPELFLLIIGGTSEQVKFYSDVVNRLGISEYCTFTGRISPNEAKHYISQANVQISSRISGQNTPLKIYEQLSNGIPIVATNIYSHTQVLNHDVAFLVQPEPASMAEGILAALEPNGEGNIKAMRAKQVYEQRYSRTIYQQKMQQIMEKIMGLDLKTEHSMNNSGLNDYHTNIKS